MTIVLSIVFRRGFRTFEQFFGSIGFTCTKARTDSYRRNYECSRVTASQNVQVDIFQKSGLKFIKKRQTIISRTVPCWTFGTACAWGQ